MLRVSFCLLVLLGAVACADGSWTFAVISDLHIGETPDAVVKVREAVAAINEFAKAKQTRFVLVLGDMTSNALWEQYVECKATLDQLTIPYYPIFGNHDVWRYTRPTTWDSWEEEEPTGDLLFLKTFGDRIKQDSLVHSYSGDTAVPYPILNYPVHLHNYEIQIPAWPNATSAGPLVVYCMDWVTRSAANNPKDFLKGAGPTGSLHNYDGGSLPWLQSRLEVIPKNVSNIIFAHHHTYVTTPAPLMPDYFSLDADDRRLFKAVLEQAFPVETYWGALTGHMHFWDDRAGVFPSFRQWETTAAKDAGRQGISVVTVDSVTNQVVDVQRCCDVASERAATVRDFFLVCLAAAIEVFAVYLLASSLRHYDNSATTPIYSPRILLSLLVAFVCLGASCVVPMAGGLSSLSRALNVNSIGPIAISFNMVVAELLLREKITVRAIFSFACVALGGSLADSSRQRTWTYWMSPGANWDVFVFLVPVIVFLGAAAARYYHARSKATYFFVPVLLSCVAGLLLDAFKQFLAAVLYVCLSPITAHGFSTGIYLLAALLMLILLLALASLQLALRDCPSLIVVPLVHSALTGSNIVCQLILRQPAYPISPLAWAGSIGGYLCVLYGTIRLVKDAQTSLLPAAPQLPYVAVTCK